MEAGLAELTKQLPKIRTPKGGDKVYKDECAYSFDNPESQDGLYICMNSWLGVGRQHLQQYYEKTGNAVFLHIIRRRKEILKDETSAEEKPTKLAIGVEGGFQTDDKRFKFEEQIDIVILPQWLTVPLSCPHLPLQVQITSAAILAAEDAAKQEEAAAMAGTWEGEKLRVSKHADSLLQLPCEKKIPPSGWKCERCDLCTNLWLNLTDGSILCGRRFFDGSGGNNHAVEHFAETKYPLAVKLGTITVKNGVCTGDVYSYDEDDMVEDPHLAKHLTHFGINVAALEKTDKTMTELEIDINVKLGEWDVIQESGAALTPAHGPGHTGMRNLGNSCYMNSVMQVLFTLPDFQQCYFSPAAQIVSSAPGNPSNDFGTQMTKLAHGLLSGDYSKPPEQESKDGYVPPPTGLRPQMFKTLVGRGHAEFSTKRQQDAHEFLMHVLSMVERSRRGQSNPCDCLRFQVEEKVVCSSSKKVAINHREDYCLALPVPMDTVTNLEEVRKYNEAKAEAIKSKTQEPPLVRPSVPFTACLRSFLDTETVDDFYSSAIQAKTTALKTTRLSSFPDFLLVQLRKYTVGDDWVPRKLDVSVTPPDELDLSELRGHGLAAGEEELPQMERGDDSRPEEVVIDEASVAMLMDMGFPREGCRRAVHATGNCGVEAAMNWVFEHSGDPDFALPFDPKPKSSKPAGGGGGGFTPNPDALEMIQAMGFTAEQATKALKATNNSAERAVDWIFSHADDLTSDPEPMDTDAAQPPAAAPKFRDGCGKYRLVGFISHMGTNTNVGHYVCHILKDQRWVIFNDEKVALSEAPPRDLAYLYLYQRL